MTSLPLSPLSDQARLWIYPFARELREEEVALIESQLRHFTSRWRSHGAPVHSAWEIRERRFVLLAGELPDDTISGCGIDASVRVFKDLRDQHGLDGMQHHLIYYRDSEGAIRALPRPDFQQAVASAEVTAATTVFDPTISDLASYRAGAFERPMAESWHARAFAAKA